MLFEEPNSLFVVKTHHPLQQPHQLFAAQGPTGRQHLVIEVLDANPGVFLEDIQLVQKLLDIGKLHIPRELLRLRRHLEGGGRRAMPPTGIKEPELDSLHSRRLLQDWRASMLQEHKLWKSRVESAN